MLTNTSWLTHLHNKYRDTSINSIRMISICSLLGAARQKAGVERDAGRVLRRQQAILTR